jgi:hypothetical protein
MNTAARKGFLGIFPLLTLTLSGCGSTASIPVSTVHWPAPANAVQATRRAGLVPENYEHLTYHVHAHLDVFINGARVSVPAGIGINIHDPGVHRTGRGNGVQYGYIKRCKKRCISPLHTHDTTGVLHTETATVSPNHLGQFFTEWGVRLTPSCVARYCRSQTSIAIFVNGKRFRGNPRTIVLSDHREIAVVIGKPPSEIPSSYDFGQL